MREEYRMILKTCFQCNLIENRKRLGFTQSTMAEKLEMDDRSYADLEHGKSCCSAVTLVLYLVYICKDTTEFLEEIRHAFENKDNQVA